MAASNFLKDICSIVGHDYSPMLTVNQKAEVAPDGVRTITNSSSAGDCYRCKQPSPYIKTSMIEYDLEGKATYTIL